MRLASIHGLISARLDVRHRFVVSVARSVTGPIQSFGGSVGNWSDKTVGSAGVPGVTFLLGNTDGTGRCPAFGGGQASPCTFSRSRKTSDQGEELYDHCAA